MCALSSRTSRAALRKLLAALNGVTITDPSAAGGAIVTFTVAGLAADDARAELTRRDVHLVSVPAGHGRWDLAARELPSVLRASVHVYNDDADLNALVGAVDEVARGVAPRRSAGRAPVETVDAVVLGLGAHGSAAAHELAGRGVRVVGFDRFRTGHVRGSSHGATRMIRRAYPDPVWDDLVEQAYAGWDRLERDSGVPLVRRVGGVFARHGGGLVGLRGPGCREIDAAEAAGLAPALRLPDTATALYDPAAGIIDAEAALRVTRTLAEAAGADLRAGEPVLGCETRGDGSIAVQTPGGSILTRTLVVCAGPWAGALLPELAPRLDVQRIVNAYFPAAGFGPPRLGAFSVELPAGLLYGIPALDGRGVKIGLDAGPAEDPDAPAGPATAAELELLRDSAGRARRPAAPEATARTFHVTGADDATGGRLAPQPPETAEAVSWQYDPDDLMPSAVRDTFAFLRTYPGGAADPRPGRRAGLHQRRTRPPARPRRSRRRVPPRGELRADVRPARAGECRPLARERVLQTRLMTIDCGSVNSSIA